MWHIHSAADLITVLSQVFSSQRVAAARRGWGLDEDVSGGGVSDGLEDGCYIGGLRGGGGKSTVSSVLWSDTDCYVWVS